MADATVDPPAFGPDHPAPGAAPGAPEPAAARPAAPAAPSVPPGGARIVAQRLAASRSVPGALPGLGESGAAAALAQFNAAQRGPIAKARLAVWAVGGVASLALLAGIGAWGYKVVLREMFGPPVVVAEAGPMRMAPADPGGAVAPNQGLAVNAIPAAGNAAPPSDVLLLAPPGPGLAPEDMEVAQTMAEAGEVEPVMADPLAVTGVTQTAALRPAGPSADRPMTAEEVIAFADRIARGADPVPAEPAAPVALPEAAGAVADLPPIAPAPPVAIPEGTPVVSLVTAAATVPANVPGVAAALRPPPRPATLASASAAAPAPAPAEPAAQAIALTEDLPPGTSLVQLGAFDSAEVAAGEWDRLMSRFGTFLQGHERVIQRAESGGKVFYRLRAAGFSELADARRLCAALVAENAQCIPVTVR